MTGAAEFPTLWPLDLAAPDGAGLHVLCLGAHSDDIEIGCGGTILRLLEESADVTVHWVVIGATGPRETEALTSAQQFLAGAAKADIIIEHFPTSVFPYHGEAIKTFFEGLKATVSPDIIFTHYRHDRHQDHRLVSELTWNTYRHHLILEYEIPKYDGDLGSPNVFVHLDETLAGKKVDLILEAFATQRSKDWFTADTLLALMRIRGVESRAPARYAEGFYGRKLVLQPGRPR